jgi:hypothetical protein
VAYTGDGKEWGGLILCFAENRGSLRDLNAGASTHFGEVFDEQEGCRL